MDFRELQSRIYQGSKRQATAYMIVWSLLYKPNYSIELDEDMAARVENIIKLLSAAMGSHLSAGFLQKQDIRHLKRVLRK